MITVTFTDSEINMVRQALRAEQERMVKQGYIALADVIQKARGAVADALIDSNVNA